MFRRRKWPVEDFAEEVRAHLQLEADELKTAGLTEADARAAARKTFGNVTTATERFDEKGRWAWLDLSSGSPLQPPRDAAQPRLHHVGDRDARARDGRQHRRLQSDRCGIAAVAAGRGTRAPVLLQSAGAKGTGISPPYPCFERFREQATTLAGVAAYGGGDFKVKMDGQAERVFGRRISGDYFRVLGLHPAAGRLLTSADETLDPPAAVISYGYWLRRFGGSAGAIGTTFTMAVGDDKHTVDRTFTIVGVAPRGFAGLLPGRADEVMIPTTTLPAMVNDTGSPWFESVARLKPG